jgi:hypothetical protein
MLISFGNSIVVAVVLLSAARTAAASDDTSTYPELPAAKNYMHVADVAIDAFSRRLKLPAQQRAAARRYIFGRTPVREFERMMLKDAADLERGHHDAAFRKTKRYRDALEGSDWVSQRMALLIVRDALRVYERKFLRPDLLTASLFAANTRKGTEANIAGIEKQVSRKEFLQQTNSTFPLQSEDKFYFYRTAFGGGYLIARHSKVVKDDEGMFEY